MKSKLSYILWKSVLSQIVWYHFCDSVHAWMNRRHCLRECKNRLAPKWCLITVCIMLGLAEWENELNVPNEMHCIRFLRKQSHTHTHGGWLKLWSQLRVATDRFLACSVAAGRSICGCLVNQNTLGARTVTAQAPTYSSVYRRAI